MDAITLWAELQALHPERTARVSEAVASISGGADTLVARLNELSCRCRFNTDHLCRLNIDQGLKLAA